MPPLTASQLPILADGSPVELISGVVEMAWDPKPGDKGPSQGFVLKDSTGEVRCYLYGKADGSDFSPVKKGDHIELSAYKGQRGWAGLTKGTIGGEGRAAGSPKLNIYGSSRVRNLSAPAAIQAAYTAPSPSPAPAQTWPAAFAQPGEPAQGAQQSRPALQPSNLTEEDLRAAWMRSFRSLAQNFAGVGSDGHLYQSLSPEAFAAIAAAASMISIGITNGKVAISLPADENEELPPW